ncbi:MAG: hypothetical protein PUP91_27260 [Rhizonema sp. PD37]|nr:hypothetical protein [Rhizonema sp. PD37]
MTLSTFIITRALIQERYGDTAVAKGITAAFKELAENNQDAELEIVAIERRGEDKILILC